MKRRATPNDLQQVYAIYMDAAVIPFLSCDPMELEAFPTHFAELLASNAFYVYEQAGEIAGFYRVERSSGRTQHVARLRTLAVAPKFHGTGLARAMIQDQVDELRQSGILRIELSVESDNPKGIGFYKKLGFEIEDTLRKFYKRAHESHYVDDYLMALVF